MPALGSRHEYRRHTWTMPATPNTNSAGWWLALRRNCGKAGNRSVIVSCAFTMTLAWKKAASDARSPNHTRTARSAIPPPAAKAAIDAARRDAATISSAPGATNTAFWVDRTASATAAPLPSAQTAHAAADGDRDSHADASAATSRSAAWTSGLNSSADFMNCSCEVRSAVASAPVRRSCHHPPSR